MNVESIAHRAFPSRQRASPIEEPSMLNRRLLPLLFLFLSPSGQTLCAAAPPAPPPPESYDVQISYRINAFRNERLTQYYEMMNYLKKIGFQRDPTEVVPENEPEDAARTRMRGTIPAQRVGDLLSERHIKTILLIPHGAKLPEDNTQAVRVDVELIGGLNPLGQYQLWDQTFEVLAGLQFRGAVGYDHRGYTRLLGSMPYNRLETLLTDLREQPAAARLPAPFRNVWAVRKAEVFPDMPAPVPRPAPPQVPQGQEKLSPDLRALLGDGGAAARPMRLEVILAATPDEERSYRGDLGAAAPGLVVEGRIGPLVTVLANPAQAPALAALPRVVGVRLPRLAQPARPPGDFDNTRWRPLLQASGATRLQALGQRGRGIQLAVVDSNFRGWEPLVGKSLPPNTRLVDLTRERNADMQPDPFPIGAEGPGSGTRLALTIARIAPEISLTLIRVDPAAPYMLESVARSINGDPVRSIGLENRLNQLEREQYDLDKRRDALAEERREVLNDFRQEGEPAARRKAYFEKQKAYEQDTARFHATLSRYLQFQRDMASLRGIRVVASALTWSDGFPVDGTSTLSRYFDDRPFHAALWFQAAGDTAGQSWTGFFRDVDGNRVMEFAAPGQPLPANLWTPELNFLSWRTTAGKATSDIPAGTRLRLTIQWREAHDPTYARLGEDPYREPLARGLRLVLLRQLDPTGTRQPADDLEVIAQTVGLPQRLQAAPSWATYEQTLEVQVTKLGRYAVRIEGRAPETIYPPGDPTLPAMRKQAELSLRLFVATLEGGGRAVLSDFVTAGGSVGMPADARTAITVGAADDRARRQPYSAAGAPFNLDLLPKPDVLAFDLNEGTSEAAAFAAGLAALAPNRARSPQTCLQELHVLPGGLLRLPDDHPDR
jgi:hypothetical protein